MITLTKSGNTIVFTFEENGHYLFDGEIEVPVNSLTLITDNSQMATFRKSSTNDIFISATYSELGMSKSELEAWFKANACGSTGGGSESGITSGDVQTMIDTSLEDYYDIDEIDAALSGKADSSAVTEAINSAVSGKADSSAVTEAINSAVSGKADSSAVTEAINSAVSGKADSSAVTEAITAAVSGKADSSAVTEAINSAVSGKADSTAVTQEISAAISGKADSSSVYTKSEVDAALSGKADSSAVTQEISAAVSGKQDTLIAGTNIKTINNESILGSGNITIQGGGSGSSYTAGDGIDITNDVISVTGKTDSSAFTAHTADTVIHVTSAEKATWNAKSDFSGSYNDLTDKPTIPTVPTSNTAFTNDAGYITSDAISGKVDTTTYNSYTAATDTALASKQTTLTAGTNITIVDNVISATGGTGGGKAIEAGRGISVTTGETADTISFNLPISGGGRSNLSVVGGINTSASFNYSFVFGSNLSQNGGSCCALFGDSCKSNGSYTFAGGWLSEAKREGGFAYGQYVFTKNIWEHSVGRYNNSVSASTTFGDSGNTLFSVGNGTADNARHNAFEIRQNGDIYLTKDGQDVKLQDQLGGGGTVDQTIISGSTNAVAGGAVYDQLGGMKIVKLTESEYTALVTKDSNTLYCVVPDPSN